MGRLDEHGLPRRRPPRKRHPAPPADLPVPGAGHPARRGHRARRGSRDCLRPGLGKL